jgi:transcriptional regulator with XRE-family HTH domain
MRLCNERNITVNKLAVLSGITQSTIDSILKGKSKNPTFETLRKLANGFNLPFDNFVRLLNAIDYEQESIPVTPNEIPDYKEKILYKIGQNLWRVRKSKNITLYTVIKDIGTDIDTDFENGSFGRTPFTTLIALADYFNVSLDYLVGRSDDPERH